MRWQVEGHILVDSIFPSVQVIYFQPLGHFIKPGEAPTTEKGLVQIIFTRFPSDSSSPDRPSDISSAVRAERGYQFRDLPSTYIAQSSNSALFSTPQVALNPFPPSTWPIT